MYERKRIVHSHFHLNKGEKYREIEGITNHANAFLFFQIVVINANSQKQVLRKGKFLNYQVNPDYTWSQPKLRRYEEKNNFANGASYVGSKVTFDLWKSNKNTQISLKHHYNDSKCNVLFRVISNQICAMTMVCFARLLFLLADSGLRVHTLVNDLLPFVFLLYWGVGHVYTWAWEDLRVHLPSLMDHCCLGPACIDAMVWKEGRKEGRKEERKEATFVVLPILQLCFVFEKFRSHCGRFFSQTLFVGRARREEHFSWHDMKIRWMDLAPGSKLTVHQDQPLSWFFMAGQRTGYFSLHQVNFSW